MENNIGFKFTEILMKINKVCSALEINEEGHCFTSEYRKITSLFRELIACGGPYSKLLLDKIKCTVLNKEAFNTISSWIIKEAKLYIDWYLKDKTRINIIFSRDSIELAIDNEANAKYYWAINDAKKEIDKAIKDKNVWHMLARAYGSRACGGRSVESFSKEDWDYVNSDLERYKEHFNLREVNLPKMYEQYHSIALPKVRETKDKLMNIKREELEYCSKVRSDFEVDVCSKIYDYLIGIYQTDTDTQSQEALNGRLKNDTRKRTQLGRYEKLEDCIPNKEIFEKVLFLANEYYTKHNKIDGKFGYSLYCQLKGTNNLDSKGCSQSHFGELLIKEFGSKCSFIKGDAISDGKRKEDIKLKGRLESAIKQSPKKDE